MIVLHEDETHELDWEPREGTPYIDQAKQAVKAWLDWSASEFDLPEEDVNDWDVSWLLTKGGKMVVTAQPWRGEDATLIFNI
jgi:hypothetical protein